MTAVRDRREEVLEKRDQLVVRLHQLQEEAAGVRREIAKLGIGGIGGYRPQAKLTICECGRVLSARERRSHKCQKQGKP